MKPILRCLFLFCFIFGYSQSYHFDKELIYFFHKGDSNKKRIEMRVFVNSEDNFYYLKIFGKDNGRYAIIWDLRAKKRYDFDMVKNADNTYEFRFERAVPLEPKNNSYDFTSENGYVILSGKENNKKTCKYVTFGKKEYDKSLFSAFLYLADEPTEPILLKPKENFAIEYAKVILPNNSVHHYQLKSILEKNLLLETK